MPATNLRIQWENCTLKMSQKLLDSTLIINLLIYSLYIYIYAGGTHILSMHNLCKETVFIKF